MGKHHFAVEGYKRNRIYPDLIVAQNTSPPVVHVVECKGWHSSGNPDTKYKEEIAAYFDRLGRVVSWKEVGKWFEGRKFRFQVLDQEKYDASWKEQLNKILSGAS